MPIADETATPSASAPNAEMTTMDTSDDDADGQRESDQPDQDDEWEDFDDETESAAPCLFCSWSFSATACVNYNFFTLHNLYNA